MLNSAAVETSSKANQPEIETIQSTRARKHRESADEENANGLMRYFLGKAGSNSDTPALEKEFGTEGEALVESLRQGVTFYVVQEFRAVADLSGRRPQLTKEPVPVKKS